jgi:hypothetical protein
LVRTSCGRCWLRQMTQLDWRCMPKLINCECGQVIHAGSDDELIGKVESHISQRHPDLVGKLTREDILGMAEVPS